ncbi:hypothetical protein ACFWDI_24390 [Streptomyces sp. NPDC060064]|jgi:hypothetical protein|uniref:hypothetical protein n=1 Tax=Streptomyces sp. NPDC060064 TaxID=3347049 RepID=UPI00368E7AF0
MSSLRSFVLVNVLRPMGRALIAYGMYWVWIPGVNHEEIMPRDSFPREDSQEYLSLFDQIEPPSRRS